MVTFLMMAALAIAPAQQDEGSVGFKVEALYAEGAALYKAGRYQQAIDKFDSAYQLLPNPNLLYNQARCYEALGDVENALKKFRAVLSHPKTDRPVRLKTRSKILVLDAAMEASKRVSPPIEPPPSSGEPSPPQPPAAVEDSADQFGGFSDLGGDEDLFDVVIKTFDTRIYGFVDGYFEQVAPSPVINTDNTQANPFEFDVLSAHLMVQGTILGQYRYFLNLAANGAGNVLNDEPISVRNAWVEVPVLGDLLNVRIGKTYRRFGLYNEILDSTPTFIGIEPPELFDTDHLLLTRTTNLMIHGVFNFDKSSVSYALMSGNDERTQNFQVPLGADLRYQYSSNFTIGTSFYTPLGPAAPDVAIGNGPPTGGVANWHEESNYFILGGFLELNIARFIFQAEYWRAQHSATRDREKTLALDNSSLNTAQRDRFYDGVADPTVDDVRTSTNYAIDTFYIRTGYALDFDGFGSLASAWEITPYGQFDFYSNPESIVDKDFGGDNEAGLADDGIFYKATAGVVIRPAPPIALKIDGSSHIQSVNGKSTFYPEIRLSLSFYWELLE